MIRLVVKNYHNLGKGTYEFPLDKITLVRGNSGSGKTSLMTAVQYCLFSEKNPGNHNVRAMDTNVSISMENAWLIARTTDAQGGTQVIVTVGNEALKGTAATAWIKELCGSLPYWKQGVFHALRSSSTFLLTTGNEDKLVILREMAFGAHGMESVTKIISAEQKELATNLAKATGRLEALVEGDSPNDRTETLEAATLLIGQHARELASYETVFAQHLVLLKDRSYLKGCIEATEVEKVAFNAEHAPFFEHGDILGEWALLHSQLENITKDRQLLKIYKGEIQCHVESLEELGLEDGFDTMVIGSREDLEVALSGHQTLLHTLRALGVSTDEVDPLVWRQTMSDAERWKSYHQGFVGFNQDRQEFHRREGNSTDLVEPPDGIDMGSLTQLLGYIESTADQLKVIAIDIDCEEDLRLRVSAKLADSRRLLVVHHEATKWERRNVLYQELVTRRPKEVDMKRLQQFKLAAYEMSLSSMQCPSCYADLLVTDGKLQRKTVSRVDIKEEEVKQQIADAEREMQNFAECKPLLEEMQAIEVDAAYKDAVPMTQEEVDTTRKHIYLLETILQKSKIIDFNQQQRQWLLAHGARYQENQQLSSVLASDRKRLAREHESLGKLFGPEYVHEDGFEKWWLRIPGRITPGDLHEQLLRCQTDLPFIDKPKLTLASFDNIRRGRELMQTISLTRDKCNALEAEEGVSMVLPDFPVYENLERAYFSDIKGIEDLNNALKQVGNIVRKVEGLKGLYLKWSAGKDMSKKADDLQERYDRVSEEATRMELQLENLKSLQTVSDDLTARSKYLVEQAKYNQAIADIERHELEIGGCKQLLTLARETEVQVLDGKLEILNTFINDFLHKFFDEPIVFELSGDKSFKTAPGKKSVVNAKVTFKGHVYDDTEIYKLSSGENTRVSLAISAGFAKMAQFPFFIVDESLATLQTELRQHIVDVLVDALPGKSIVIILQDDNLNFYDNFISIT